MSTSPPPAPGPDEGLALHRRLLESDPTAPADLALAYLDSLVAWLTEHHPRLDRDLHTQAADDALLALIEHPASFQPAKQTLDVYLRIAAQGDLLNLLRREGKHHAGRVPWNSVELSENAGKYLGQDADPSLPLQLAEAEQELLRSVPAAVLAGLSEAEVRGLLLLRRGERSNAIWAENCGFAHLPPDELDREAKRLKDKLKKRLERARDFP
jgi:hypothetical protein